MYSSLEKEIPFAKKKKINKKAKDHEKSWTAMQINNEPAVQLIAHSEGRVS